MSAVISPDGLYRYKLTRSWSDAAPVVWIMLNPSTADATTDDPTIRKCIGFSKLWGAGGIIVHNLFAFRATNPKALKTVADPFGPDNDQYLGTIPSKLLKVAAWGKDGSLRNASQFARKIISDLACLGTCKNGEPKHPLYLSYETSLENLQ